MSETIKLYKQLQQDLSARLDKYATLTQDQQIKYKDKAIAISEEIAKLQGKILEEEAKGRQEEGRLF